MRHKLPCSFAFTDFVKFEPWFVVCTGHSIGRLKIFTCYVKNRRFEDLFKELRGGAAKVLIVHTKCFYRSHGGRREWRAVYDQPSPLLKLQVKPSNSSTHPLLTKWLGRIARQISPNIDFIGWCWSTYPRPIRHFTFSGALGVLGGLRITEFQTSQSSWSREKDPRWGRFFICLLY